MQYIKSVLKVIVPLLLALLLMAYVLRDVEPTQLWTKIKNANYNWVLLAIAISILSHIIRATRWKIMLQPLGHKPSNFPLFMAVMIGYFANIFLPRAGEFIRCWALNRSNKVPINEAFGTVIAERVIDFLVLLSLMAFSLALEYQRFSAFLGSILFNKKNGGVGMVDFLLKHYIIVTAALLVLGALAWYKWKSIIESTLFKKIWSFLMGIFQGVMSIRKIKNKWSYLAQTLLIWLCYYFMTYLMFFSLEPTSALSPEAGLVILIVGGLGMSAPVSGGIGPFHLMVSSALSILYGLSHNDGIAYAFVIHTSQMLMVLVIGGLAGLVNIIKYRNSAIVQ